jgi:TonB family protein
MMSMRSALYVAGSLTIAVTASGAIPAGYTPPRLRGGELPATQIAAVGGGEVLLQVELGENGSITNIVPLRVTPPFTEALIRSVRQWTFAPAIQDMQPEPGEIPQTVSRNLVKSKVLVAAMFRAPVLTGPTLGVAPSDVGSASSDVAVATSTTMPVFPPNAIIDGTVLVEVHVGRNGSVTDARVVQSTRSGFDGAALNAVNSWSFRPARVSGALTDSYAYIAFAFRAPVSGPSPSGRPGPTGVTGPTASTGSLTPSF